MVFVGNLLWFVLGGLFMCVEWALIGAFFCLTIIGIPFGIAAFRIAGFAAFPFGKELIPVEMLGEKRIAGTGVANFLWVILAGFWLALGHSIWGILLCLTVIGIPWGIAHFNLAQACFAPLGKRVVPKQLGDIARSRYFHGQLDQRFAPRMNSAPHQPMPVAMQMAQGVPMMRMMPMQPMMPAQQMMQAPRMAPVPPTVPAATRLKYCHVCGVQVHPTASTCVACRAQLRPA